MDNSFVQVRRISSTVIGAKYVDEAGEDRGYAGVTGQIGIESIGGKLQALVTLSGTYNTGAISLALDILKTFHLVAPFPCFLYRGKMYKFAKICDKVMFLEMK